MQLGNSSILWAGRLFDAAVAIAYAAVTIAYEAQRLAPPPSAGDHAPAIPLDHSRTGLSTGSSLGSRSPSRNIRPMEPCAPCPITDRDPEGVASPVEDCHMVTRGPALLWSLLGPDRQLVATLCGACPGRVHSAVSESMESSAPCPTLDWGTGGGVTWALKVCHLVTQRRQEGSGCLTWREIHLESPPPQGTDPAGAPLALIWGSGAISTT